MAQATCSAPGCERPRHGQQLYCRQHWSRWKRGDLKLWLPVHATPEQRFWLKVAKTDTCWSWTAARLPHGYGLFYANSQKVLAHRFSYELHYGPIPPGFNIRHRCDNPPCIRPDHLALGTQADNVTDMIQRGRMNHSNKAVGERHPSHRLTEGTVRAIRDRYAAGGVRQVELAQEYGISQPSISALLRRQTWRHI